MYGELEIRSGLNEGERLIYIPVTSLSSYYEKPLLGLDYSIKGLSVTVLWDFLIVRVKSALATSISYSAAAFSFFVRSNYYIFSFNSFNFLTYADISRTYSFVGLSSLCLLSKEASEWEDLDRSKFPKLSSSWFPEKDEWEDAPSWSPFVSSFTISLI